MLKHRGAFREAEITPAEPESDNSRVGSVSRRRATAVALLLYAAAPVRAWEASCKPFHEVYTGGEDMCNRIFGDSFKYEAEEADAYTMWWFGGDNPNRATAEGLGLTVPNTCELSYFHKDIPSPEGDDFTECLPWKEEACCHNSTVVSAEALRLSYGPGYEWDRCGPMSQECARFFVQEACLYECDITAGLYRKCSDAEVAAAANDENDPCYENYWQLERMPIKASYCNAWHDACRNDYFCAGGDFFSCNALYWENLAQDEADAAAAQAQSLKQAQDRAIASDAAAQQAQSSTTVVIVIIVAVVGLFAGALCYIIKREKSGKPIFMSLVQQDPDHAEQEQEA